MSATDSLKVSESIVVSPKYLAELKRLPDDVLSFSGAVNEVSLIRKLCLRSLKQPKVSDNPGTVYADPLYQCQPRYSCSSSHHPKTLDSCPRYVTGSRAVEAKAQANPS
jgi:hypothetical protein